MMPMTDFNHVHSDKFALPSVSYLNFCANPFYLRTLSRLVGIDAAPLASTKILDLGCAYGGIFCRLRWNFLIRIPLELIFQANLFLKVMIWNFPLIWLISIWFDANSWMWILSFGIFDYIIVHDVFSLVSNDVRNKILATYKENLNENGLAYISYNTLPVINKSATIRELAHFHSNNF